MPAEADSGALEARIGYRFNDPALLRRALTHPSHAPARLSGQHNQRLEFLGDAVLGLVLAEELYALWPDAREGELTRARSMLAKGGQVSTLAAAIGLGDHLLLGEAEAAQGARARASILEDALEALIGAVYLDGGLAAARAVVRAVYGPLDQLLARLQAAHNPKGRLQERLQPGVEADAIEYRVVEEHGPGHQKAFTVEVWIAGVCRGRGSGPSKKLAEEAAATAALESME